MEAGTTKMAKKEEVYTYFVVGHGTSPFEEIVFNGETKCIIYVDKDNDMMHNCA